MYVLKSLKMNRFYIGQTGDLTDRLKRHSEGRVRSTRAFAPWSIAYFEKFETRTAAMKRERELKGLKGTAKFLRVVGAGKIRIAKRVFKLTSLSSIN